MMEELDYEEARELKKSLEDLFVSRGWEFVEYFLSKRADDRERQLYGMCPEDMAEAVRFARVKGGVEELRLLPDMLKQVLADIEDHLEDLKEDDDGTEE